MVSADQRVDCNQKHDITIFTLEIAKMNMQFAILIGFIFKLIERVNR